jgi:hypothetical protein
MSKGSTRRKEDSQKVRDNWGAIFGKPTSTPLMESVLKAACWVDNCECQNPGTCSHPFCNCEVKHEPT